MLLIYWNTRTRISFHIPDMVAQNRIRELLLNTFANMLGMWVLGFHISSRLHECFRHLIAVLEPKMSWVYNNNNNEVDWAGSVLMEEWGQEYIVLCHTQSHSVESVQSKTYISTWVCSMIRNSLCSHLHCYRTVIIYSIALHWRGLCGKYIYIYIYEIRLSHM